MIVFLLEKYNSEARYSNKGCRQRLLPVFCAGEGTDLAVKNWLVTVASALGGYWENPYQRAAPAQYKFYIHLY